ncbi:MAG: xanthine dehydrogenase family protein molybdopterin-binding subunit [Bacteroidota bacterium]|nr:xanthine dehydrogenase family protein molybdopterin-binding subunit [Bacteroidota bacterium]
MVRGEEVFIQDLRFPGMVHATVVRPPNYYSRLISVDEKQLKKKVPGILKVIKDGNFLAVVADEEYQVLKAQVFLKQYTKWAIDDPLIVAKDFPAFIKSLPVESENVMHEGKVEHALKENVFRARYFRPYQMHASIGPSCAIALFENNKLYIWSHSQGVYPLRESLKKLLNMDEKDIHIKGVPGSGCYGHNGADDVAADCAIAALAYPGKHVRMQWSRDDEHAWEPYGSAMLLESEATLDQEGKIASWKFELWSDSHSTRPGGEAAQLLPARYLKNPHTLTSSGFKGGALRNSQPYYKIPNVQVDFHYFKGPL